MDSGETDAREFKFAERQCCLKNCARVYATLACFARIAYECSTWSPGLSANSCQDWLLDIGVLDRQYLKKLKTQQLQNESKKQAGLPSSSLVQMTYPGFMPMCTGLFVDLECLQPGTWRDAPT